MSPDGAIEDGLVQGSCARRGWRPCALLSSNTVCWRRRVRSSPCASTRGRCTTLTSGSSRSFAKGARSSLRLKVGCDYSLGYYLRLAPMSVASYCVLKSKIHAGHAAQITKFSKALSGFSYPPLAGSTPTADEDVVGAWTLRTRVFNSDPFVDLSTYFYV